MSIRSIQISVTVLVIIAIVLAAIQFTLTGAVGPIYAHLLADYYEEGVASIGVFSSDGRYFSAGVTPWKGYYENNTLFVVIPIQGEVKVCFDNSHEIISEKKEYNLDQPTHLSVVPTYMECDEK